MKNFGTAHHGWPLGLLDRLDPCLVVFSNYLPILCCQVTILKLGKLTQDPANIPLKSSYGQKTIQGNGNGNDNPSGDCVTNTIEGFEASFHENNLHRDQAFRLLEQKCKQV